MYRWASTRRSATWIHEFTATPGTEAQHVCSSARVMLQRYICLLARLGSSAPSRQALGSSAPSRQASFRSYKSPLSVSPPAYAHRKPLEETTEVGGLTLGSSILASKGKPLELLEIRVAMSIIAYDMIIATRSAPEEVRREDARPRRTARSAGVVPQCRRPPSTADSKVAGAALRRLMSPLHASSNSRGLLIPRSKSRNCEVVRPSVLQSEAERDEAREERLTPEVLTHVGLVLVL